MVEIATRSQSCILRRIPPGQSNIPSTIPKPDRRMGTRDMDAGDTVLVVYSYPSLVLAFGDCQYAYVVVRP